MHEEQQRQAVRTNCLGGDRLPGAAAPAPALAPASLADLLLVLNLIAVQDASIWRSARRHGWAPVAAALCGGESLHDRHMPARPFSRRPHQALNNFPPP